MDKELSWTVSRFVIWALFSVTLAISPIWTLDPINPVKMLAVVIFAFIMLGIFLVNGKDISWGNFKLPGVILGFFLVWQLVVLVGSGASILRQLFGDDGRNTGFITYLGFVILMLAAMLAAGQPILKRVQVIGYVVGGASSIYGLLQSFGWDPFNWVSLYSPVFGFVGNPNFQSSLLGILGTLAFAQLLAKENSATARILTIYYLGLIGYVIFKTNSQQGILVLLIGIAVIVGIYVKSNFNRVVKLSYLIILSIGFIAVSLGVLNKGPISGLLYGETIKLRIFYWSAGWKMTIDHPVFGVGLDNYGEWYRRSRSLEAILEKGPEVITNAAHNVYLDISSYGGFPLLIAYLTIAVLVLVSAVKVIRREKEFNAALAGIIAAWVAFQAQSVISINQIGLAIWGWVLSGLIIGYEINTRDGESEIPRRVLSKKEQKKVKSLMSKTQTSPATSLAIFVGLIVGIVVGISPYLASAKYKQALETGDSKLIQEAAYIWPLEATRMNQVATTLLQNNFVAGGFKVASDTVKEFPDDFASWRILYSMKDATEQQKREALAQMKRLDPLNSDLK